MLFQKQNTSRAFTALVILSLVLSCALVAFAVEEVKTDNIKSSTSSSSSSSSPSKGAKTTSITGSSSAQSYSIEGELIVQQNGLVVAEGWQKDTRILLNGGEQITYLLPDSTFVFLDARPGIHVLEVAHPLYFFETLQVEVSAKHNGRVRVKKASLYPEVTAASSSAEGDSLAGSGVGSSEFLPYPVKLQAVGRVQYFQKREGVDFRGMLMNPMVIMMVVMVGFAYFMPKLTENMDPEEKKQMQEGNPLNQNVDVPDFASMLANLMSGQQQQQQSGSKSSLTSRSK